MQNNVRQTARSTPKRSKKRESLLALGAAKMNAAGPGAVKLSEIAEELGLSRNALYYYVADRSDLIFQCYIQTCDNRLAMLDTIVSAGGSPSRQLQLVIKGWLAPSSADQAIISDLDLLEEPQRVIVWTKLEAIENSIALILKNGCAQGSLRAFDTHLVAQMLVGTLNWGILWYNWISRSFEIRAENLQRAAKVVETAFLHGLSLHGSQPPKLPTVLQLKLYQLLESGHSNQTPDLTRRELVHEASRLFSRRGVDSVPIDDVADAIGVTKGAVYHHFSDKAHLLTACYDRAFDIYEGIIGSVMVAGLDGFSSLLAVFQLNSEAQLQLNPPMILLQPGLSNLPASYRARAEGMSANMLTLYERGQKDGSLTEVDYLVVEALAGAFFWIQKWRTDKPDRTAESIIAQMVDVFTNGLASPKKIA